MHTRKCGGTAWRLQTVFAGKAGKADVLGETFRKQEIHSYALRKLYPVYPHNPQMRVRNAGKAGKAGKLWSMAR